MKKKEQKTDNDQHRIGLSLVHKGSLDGKLQLMMGRICQTGEF